MSQHHISPVMHMHYERVLLLAWETNPTIAYRMHLAGYSRKLPLVRGEYCSLLQCSMLATGGTCGKRLSPRHEVRIALATKPRRSSVEATLSTARHASSSMLSPNQPNGVGCHASK